MDPSIHIGRIHGDSLDTEISVLQINPEKHMDVCLELPFGILDW